MKACVPTGEKRRIECKEVPTPSIEPGMLLLKTKYCCICGSDLGYLDGFWSSRMLTQGVTHPGAVMGHRMAAELGLTDFSSLLTPAPRPGARLGHEWVGEVVEVGEGVTGWAVGDRAVPGGPRVSGGPPPQRRRLPGISEMGAMAEYILTGPSVQKVPAHVSDEEAVFVEPLGIAVGSVIGSGLKAGESGVIIGVGKIGLLAMMFAKVVGAAPVIGVDLVQSRLDKALELGADAVVNASEVDAISEVVKLTEDGADAIIILVRDGKVLNQAVEMSSHGATIALAGYMPLTEVNPMLWTVKRLRVVGVGSMPAGRQSSFGLSLNLLAHKQIDPRPLISEIMPLEDIQRAFDSQYSGENIAVLLKP